MAYIADFSNFLYKYELLPLLLFTVVAWLCVNRSPRPGVECPALNVLGLDTIQFTKNMSCALHTFVMFIWYSSTLLYCEIRFHRTARLVQLPSIISSPFAYLAVLEHYSMTSCCLLCRVCGQLPDAVQKAFGRWRAWLTLVAAIYPPTGGHLLRCLRQKAPELQTTNRLLRLPGEIRNQIMEYALTSDASLRFLHTTSNERSTFVEHHHRDKDKQTQASYHIENQEFNVIKFVCRQLYAETSNLECRLNTLEMCQEEDSARISSTQLAYWFLSNCVKSNVTPTNIHIYDDIGVITPLSGRAKQVAVCLEVARVNPGIQIEYILTTATEKTKPGPSRFDLHDSLRTKQGIGLALSAISLAASRGRTDWESIFAFQISPATMQHPELATVLQNAPNVIFRLSSNVDVKVLGHALIRTRPSSQLGFCMYFQMDAYRTFMSEFKGMGI